MKTLAIIGIGPRGLYALENLLIQLSKGNNQVRVIGFEPCDEPGAGQVWYTSQSNSNWANISERALKDLKGRPAIKINSVIIEAFPSYHDWSNFSQTDIEADTFPPRHKIGSYLHERFEALVNNLKKFPFELFRTRVNAIDFDNEKLIIKTDQQDHKCDDAVITIGHQPTTLSNQITKWKKHASKHNSIHVFENSYPLIQFNEIKNKTDINIGIRGFGLAMIDVMRGLAINSYGNFKIENETTFKSTYQKSKDQHLKLIPFSLDGLPMTPKPLNEQIDNWYLPTEDELAYFKTEIETVTRTNASVTTLEFLTLPIARITSRVYGDLKSKSIRQNLDKKQLETLILKWLETPDFKHVLFQDNAAPTYDIIKSYVDMALGLQSISLDYCIGQVWRHCQPTLYKSFSHAKLDNETIESVIALDEQSKRFSYGPPIESMQQILALVDANVLNLDFVSNPDIELVENGWVLKNKQHKTIQIDTMINSVLDAPKLLDVNSSIIKTLLHNDYIEPIHSNLGIDTHTNGYVSNEDNQKDVPIAILGRLAKGSVIGVDAILECFGSRIETWAEHYVKQLNT